MDLNGWKQGKAKERDSWREKERERERDANSRVAFCGALRAGHFAWLMAFHRP